MGKGGNDNSEQIEAQYEYDTAKYQFDWDQMQKKYTHQKGMYDVQIWNAEQSRQYKNEVASQQWADKEKMRIFDYNNQVEAYNASKEAYAKQLDYNNLAAEMSASDNTRKYNERLTSIGFQNEELMMKHGWATRELTEDIKGKKAQTAFQGEMNKLQAMDTQGKILNMGQAGRTARKNMSAAMAQAAIKQQMLFDNITRQDTIYGMKVEQSFEQANLNQRQLIESMKSAGGQYEADQMNIALQKYSADLGAESKLAPEPKRKPQMSRPLDLPKARNVEPEKPPSWEEFQKIKPIEGAVTKGPSGFSQFLSVVGTVAGAIAMSDDRLKSTYNRVGTSPSGVPVYTFRYKHEGDHGPWYTGTSAQDLLEMGRDDAVVQKEKDGFYYVDYSKLDVEFEQVQLA